MDADEFVARMVAAGVPDIQFLPTSRAKSTPLPSLYFASKPLLCSQLSEALNCSFQCKVLDCNKGGPDTFKRLQLGQGQMAWVKALNSGWSAHIMHMLPWQGWRHSSPVCLMLGAMPAHPHLQTAKGWKRQPMQLIWSGKMQRAAWLPPA